MSVQRIRPFLWYEKDALAAANHYIAIFDNSKIVNLIPSGDPDTPSAVEFQLEGLHYIAFNGGPKYKLTDAFSMLVHCETQSEVDRYWDALLADGGKPTRCGWLLDKFGLSWQIVPEALIRLMTDPDRDKAGRVVQAMLSMDKLIIADLQRAYDG